MSSELIIWDQVGMKSKSILINHPEISTRNRERCPMLRTGIKRRSKEVLIHLWSKICRRMKEQEQKITDSQRTRISKDTDVKIQRDKSKMRRKGEECIIEKIQIWVSKVKVKLS